jgi:hypothetical protein
MIDVKEDLGDLSKRKKDSSKKKKNERVEIEESR